MSDHQPNNQAVQMSQFSNLVKHISTKWRIHSRAAWLSGHIVSCHMLCWLRAPVTDVTL